MNELDRTPEGRVIAMRESVRGLEQAANVRPKSGIAYHAEINEPECAYIHHQGLNGGPCATVCEGAGQWNVMVLADNGDGPMAAVSILAPASSWKSDGYVSADIFAFDRQTLTAMRDSLNKAIDLMPK